MINQFNLLNIKNDDYLVLLIYFMMESSTKKHYVAVIGGSVSGSQAANILAEKGYKVVVFEMNDLPYGKIEDGLPKWHVNLRDKQEKNIDQKLDHPNIYFIPSVKIGRDIDFEDLLNQWGFSIIIFASGAWQDRALPVDGIDKFIDNGLIYQNSLLYWYNHKHESDYKGIKYELKDRTIVIGGGLASLDVMKLGMIELVQNALEKEKGIKIDMFTFEKKGLAKVLDETGFTLKDLNLYGMTLVYRRNATDMPLKTPKDNTKENIEKARVVSDKLLNKYVENFLFHFVPLSSPVDKVEENGILKGIVFQKNEIIDGKLLVKEGETFVLETPMVISSIGSLPEKIDGLPYQYSLLKMIGESGYRVEGFSNVFAIGNTVTGQGNIRESKKHGVLMTNKIIDDHIEKADFFEEWLGAYNESLTGEIKDQMGEIEKEILSKDSVPDRLLQNMEDKIKTYQERVGYSNYQEWIRSKTPIRLENM